MLFTAAFVCKAQITIQATDVPMPGTFKINEWSIPSNPTSGANQTWDYSSGMPIGIDSNVFTPETQTQWTGIGVDVYTEGFKNLNSAFGYKIWPEIDKAATGMIERGVKVSNQAYSLGTFTGTATDSILFPVQDVFYSSPKTIIPFPLAIGYTNSYNGDRNVVNFTLNVPAFGLNYTPCQQAFYEVRKDSVSGWGTMRVYTPSGASVAYDVLMVKTSSYTVDSFYVGGAPAPGSIQTAFQITQGQKSTYKHYYNFYRKGYFNYLVRLFYAADSTFTTMTNAFSHADGVAPTKVNDFEANSISSVLYPNPCQNSTIYLMLFGEDPVHYDKYVVTNMNGQVVFSNNTVWLQKKLTIPVNQLPNGNYGLTVIDSKSSKTLNNYFQISR